MQPLREPAERLFASLGSGALVTVEQFLQALLSPLAPTRILLNTQSDQAIGEFLEHPAVTPELALQTLMLSNALHLRQSRSWVQPGALELLQRWWRAHPGGPDALGFAELWADRGGDRQDWLLAFREERWGYVWPQLDQAFLDSYLRALLPHLLEWSQGYCGLRLMLRLQPWPEQVRGRLWQAALGEPKRERELAQQVLHDQAALEVLKSLRHPQAGPRQRAAEWAARLRLSEAVQPLSVALGKEKSERTRMAQMEALRQLGAPLDVFLNRPALLADARKRLAKENPDWLAEVPLLPMHWEADGQPLEVDLLKGWLLAAVRLKQPEPGGLFSVLAPYVRQDERRAWGLRLLEWWIARDTRPAYSPAQVERMLPEKTGLLQKFFQFMNQTRSDQAVAGEARRQLEMEIQGSAIELKGLFSLAGAFAGEAVLDPARTYVKKWYGLRAAQCKALVAMLGSIEGPSVIQYLLEVGRRFRTKGIQQEAVRVLRERAERQGWTLEELADLNLPAGGLDDAGCLELEVGERTFTATLLPDLSWKLCDVEGKVFKALPEDKEANARYRSAQKAVKEAHKALRERLYEAMCCGRSWSWSAWQTSLWRHPVATRVISSLVWLARREQQVVAFRPDADGSLIDVQQDELTLGEDWTIELAHPLLLSNADWTAWRLQLADYQLIPPFAQLGRSCQSKPPGQPEEMKYFGHLLNSFKLRNRAQALGYVRSPAEDGGVFLEYRKTLVSSGWTVRLGFTGSQLPETSHPVALQNLEFDFQNRLAHWGEVPPVLYSEALTDVEEIAREGSGFDPDWQKKASFL